MKSLKRVAVIIPFYRNSISEHESIALQQCERVLANYHKIAIKPHHLTLPPEAHQVSFTDVVSFDDDYFSGSFGYNRLMLSEEFYHRFLTYEYVLIYQLDAFVFSDKLLHWCNQGIDYVGAPWLRDIDHVDRIKAVKSKLQYYFHTRYDIQKNGGPSIKQFENRVGNGGFSLRRVKKFHHVTLTRKDDIQRYLTEVSKKKHQYSEDAFWSIQVNRKRKFLNIPSYKKGVGFAFENTLERALRLNHQHLPFGCHAWDRQLDFWRPVFRYYGYTI